MIYLVPLKQFSERIAKGWTMVPGYDLKAGDYAVTMASPGHEQAQIRANRIAARNADTERRKANAAKANEKRRAKSMADNPMQERA